MTAARRGARARKSPPKAPPKAPKTPPKEAVAPVPASVAPKRRRPPKPKPKDTWVVLPRPWFAPEGFTILGHVWPITYARKIVFKGEPVFGLTDLVDRYVLIDIEESVDQVTRTLFHEWVHAVISTANLDFPLELEERLCTVMGHAMHEMLSTIGPALQSLAEACARERIAYRRPV